MKKISILLSCLCMTAFVQAAPIEQRNLSTTTNNTELAPTQQSSQFWELHQQIQQLQNQIRQLRGLIEEQDNQIEQMNKELQNRYTDLDQRLELVNQKIDSSEESEEVTDAPLGSAPAASATVPNQSSSSNPAARQSATPAPKTTTPTNMTNSATAAKMANSTVPSTATANTPAQNPLASNANVAADEAAYRLAYDAYTQGGAARAIIPMENFIKTYPNSPYVSHAYYWLGEFNLSLTPPNYNQAKDNFEIAAGNYPKSNKAPAALYRLSEIAKNIDKDIPRAREYYLRLIQNYANSREAQIARTSINL